MSLHQGDNSIMELKIVQDVARGRTAKLPWGLFWRVGFDPRGRRAIGAYLARLAKATWLGRAAVNDGQLLKVRWCACSACSHAHTGRTPRAFLL